MEKTVLVFPGQGSQKPGMGQDLANNFPIASATFAEADEILGFRLSELMFNGPANELTLTANAQPALLTVSVATLKVLTAHYQLAISEIADFCAGHSLGEYSALVAAEVISFPDALRLVRKRGQAMQSVTTSSDNAQQRTQIHMLAVLGLEVTELSALISEVLEHATSTATLVIANDNANGQVVVSGDSDLLYALQDRARQNKIKAIPLPVSAPFHSPLMAGAAEVMRHQLSEITFNNARIPIVSNVSAQPVQAAAVIKENILQQICGQVRWRETITNLVNNHQVGSQIECGTGRVLSGLARRIDRKINVCNLDTAADISSWIKDRKLMDNEQNLL